MALPIRDDAPTRRVPWMTYALLLTNVVVFLFLQPAPFQGGGSMDGIDEFENREALSFIYEWGAVPCELEEGEPVGDPDVSCETEPLEGATLPEDKVVYLSLLTSLFLHGGLGHLAGNMLFLWVFGNNVEDRLGPWPYLAFYLFTGVVATAGHTLANQGDAVPVVGASGAISGLMGAYLVFRPRGRVLTIVGSAAFQVVYVPAWTVLGLFFVTQFFTPEDAGVAWVAHAAGMAAGALLGLLLARIFHDPEWRPAPQPVDAVWALPEAPPVR